MNYGTSVPATKVPIAENNEALTLGHIKCKGQGNLELTARGRVPRALLDAAYQEDTEQVAREFLKL